MRQTLQRWGCAFLFFLNSAVASAMEFEIYQGTPACEGCLIVRADGDISEATPVLFAAFLDDIGADRGEDTTVVFNSLGGSLLGGIELGKLIRNSGFNTHIARVKEAEGERYVLEGGSCASACAYAFLGGQRRSMEVQSKYGLHQVSSNSDALVPLVEAVRLTQDIIASLIDYIEDMGASSEIVVLATQTSDTSISWITAADLSALRILNVSGLTQQRGWEKTSSGGWSTWSILPDGTRDLLILSCNQIPSRLNRAGYIRLSLRQWKALPQEHLYYNSLTELPVTIIYNGVPIDAVRDITFVFDSTGHSTHGLEVPISVLQKAVEESKRLSAWISYSEDFPETFAAEHPIPLVGVNEALGALTVRCPHLSLQ